MRYTHSLFETPITEGQWPAALLLTLDSAQDHFSRKAVEAAQNLVQKYLPASPSPRLASQGWDSLRHLAKAQGMAKLVRAADIERESLYRSLSLRGSARLSTLVVFTQPIGLGLTSKMPNERIA